jgi:glyoxylase-like metal-dependent hydrolase (beta-lactamase superfamily II)
MHSISRRGFVISAATAAAAFGLDGPLECIGPALAQAPDPTLVEKGFAKFGVGDLEVIQMYDGIWEKAHDPGFIKNASIDETKTALGAGGLSSEFVPITFTVTAVRLKGELILFDAGTGNQVFPKAGAFAVKNMQAAGLDPSQIKTIVITHFHPDHITGLMAKDTNAPIFPNAEIHVPAVDWRYWTDPATTAGAAKRIQAVLPGWNNIKPFEGDMEIVPGVRAIATFGHTPGHTSYQLGSGSQQLIVLGDVSNIPALFVAHPEWRAAFDTDGALAEANRRKMFDRVIADAATVTGYHFGMPGAGTIQKDGKGYAFLPIKV